MRAVNKEPAPVEREISVADCPFIVREFHGANSKFPQLVSAMMSHMVADARKVGGCGLGVELDAAESFIKENSGKWLAAEGTNIALKVTRNLEKGKQE